MKPHFLEILVEGQTEESFVKKLLEPALVERRLYVRPVLVQSGRGGHCRNYDHIWPDAVRLLNQPQKNCVRHVTTMLDLYGIPTNFPGHGGAARLHGRARAEFLERAFAADIEKRTDHARAQLFLPNLLVHEYEALLFTLPAAIQAQLIEPHRQRDLEEILRSANGQPEEVNDGPETAPSKRLAQLFPRYHKVVDGPTIAAAIGLPALRQANPHFHAWLQRLEALIEGE